MIIFSSNSREQILKLSLNETFRCYKAKVGNITLDFGKHLIFNNFKEALNGIAYCNMIPEFLDSSIIEDLDKISEDIYLYEVDEEEFIIRNITENDLLSSDDDDMFAVGCLLASRKVYNSKNTMLEEELKIDGETIFNLDKDTLINLILKKDATGQASLIGDILLCDSNDERLYENTLRLDATGVLAYKFIIQSGFYVERPFNKVVSSDSKGDLIVDLLNWIDSSPMLLAEKIVSMKNPFRVIDFINRYDEYLDNVRDFKGNTDFVKSEETVKNYLYTALINFDYNNMSIEKFINNDMYYYTSLKSSVFKILNSMIEKGKTDSAKAFLELMKNKFNSEFVDEFDNTIYKEDISKVQSYDLNGSIFTILNIKERFFIIEKSRDEFLRLSGDLMVNTNGYIELNKLA